MPKVGMEPIRRSQIINAALECICCAGIEKMTLDMVAREAGCSKGVISYYFQGKDDLVLEAFKAFLAYYKKKIDSEIKPTMSPMEMLGVVQQNALPPFPGDAGSPKLNVSELDRVDNMDIPPDKKAKLFLHFFSRALLDTKLQDVIREIYPQDMQGMASIIDYGVKLGQFQTDSIPQATYGLMCMYIGISVFRVVGFSPEEIGDDTQIFWNYVKGICTKPQL